MNSSTDTGGPSPASLKKHTFAHRVASVFPWAMGFWLIVMTGWYVATVVNSLHHPMNTGDDLVWARWWVCLAVAIVLSHLLVRRRLVTVIWLVLLSATAILMIILSQHVTAALITAWLLLLSWTWGDFLLRKIGVPSSARVLERIALAVPLGLALMGLVALVLCMTRFLSPKWAWLSLLILTLAQWRSLRHLLLNFHRWIASDRPFAATAPILPDVGILVAFMGFVFLLDLSWALAPEIHYDALAAHLPVAQNYVEHPVGLLSYGYIANLVNLLFALAMSLQGQTVAKLIVLASSVLAALGVYTLGQMFLSRRVGLWAAALFFTTPLVSWLATTTYIDALVTMFLVSALLAFFRWQEDRERGWLWACGLLTGAAVAAKLNALLGLPVVGLLLLWYVIRSRQSVRERLKGFGGYILGVVLVAAPGYSIAYALTGNPFYPLPLFDKLFKSSVGPSVNLISNSNLFGIGTSPTALLKLPMALTFDTARFGEALPEGGVGLALILVPLALPLLITGAGPLRRRTAMFLAVGLVYVACQAYIMQYGRYYIPVLPVIAVLAVAPLFHFSKPKWLLGLNLVLLGVVIAAQVALSPRMYWNIPDRFPMKMAFGLETREALLSRALRLYGPIRFLNTKVGPGDKVLAVGGDTGRIYLNAPMATPFDPEIYQVQARSTPDTLASNLIQNGVTYLFVNRESWQSTIEFSYLTESFLSKFADMEYAANKINIYRLRHLPVEAGAASNLLSNPGFELLSASGYPADWVSYGQPRMSKTSTDAHGGKIAVTIGREDGMYARLPIEANKMYSLGYWCRAANPNQLARQQINWLDSSLQIVGVSLEVVSCGPQWERKKFSALSPQGASLAQVYANVHENSEVSLDDYMFVQGQLPTQP